MIRPEDGRDAVELLDVAIENAQLPGERLIPRLFALTCQVLLQGSGLQQHGGSGSRTTTGGGRCLNDMHKQICKLLDHHKTFFFNDIEFTSHQVNDTCSQFIIGLVLESNQTRIRLSKQRQNQIQALMKRLDELYSDPSVPLAATWISCNAYIMFYCNQGRPDEALKLLQWMVETSPTHPVDLIPRVNAFATTISAFAKVGNGPEKSMEVLDWMLTLYDEGKGPAPKSSCFNALLDAWVKSGRRDAGIRAEQILDWMQQLHDTKGMETAPNIISWNTAINVWGNSPVADAAENAEALLRKMISQFEAGSSVEPENISFISVMNAWANSGRKNAPDRVIMLLDLMRNMAKGSNSLQINSYAYSVLLKAYEKTERPVSTQESNHAVLQILGALDQIKVEGIEATPAIHNGAIMALCNFSVVSAVLYFIEVEESYRTGKATIDVRTFNSGLSAMAILNRQDASDRATDVLDRMKRYSKSDRSVTPDQTTSNVMLKLLSRSPSTDGAARADDLLADMESQIHFQCTQASYVTVVIAWGRSDDRGKFDRIKALLARYRAKASSGTVANPTSPNVYNAVLSVCRHNEIIDLNERALDMVGYTLDMLRDDDLVRPDETTYLTLFQAFHRLLGHSDIQHLRGVLEREIGYCIKDGLVSKAIVEVIYQACPALFSSLFGENVPPDEVKIPAAWSKKLRKEKV